MSSAPIRERLSWELDPQTYQVIRRLWINHSKAEDARDLQGLIEVTRMTGTHRGTWAGLPPTGRQIDTPIVIHFPWDPSAGKFAGERIYYDSAAFSRLSGGESG